MRLFLNSTAAFVTLILATTAQATTIRFDALDRVYGGASPLGANMTGNGQYLSYAEAGYMLTLNTANDPAEPSGAHIGDGIIDGEFVPGLYSWHDDGTNLPGAYVTLAKSDGGAFNLISVDYSNDFGGLFITGGNGPLVFTGANTAFLNLKNVSSVTFYSLDYGNNHLDSILVTASVPEPATWTMMLIGFGFIGYRLRGQTVSKSII